MKRSYCIPVKYKWVGIDKIPIIAALVFVFAISSLLGGCASSINEGTNNQQTEGNQSSTDATANTEENSPPQDNKSPSDSDGQELYRVRVGPYGSRNDAEEASGELTTLGYPVSIVNDESYFVQIGAFSIMDNAYKLQREVLGRGYEVIITDYNDETPSSSTVVNGISTRTFLKEHDFSAAYLLEPLFTEGVNERWAGYFGAGNGDLRFGGWEFSSQAINCLIDPKDFSKRDFRWSQETDSRFSDGISAYALMVDDSTLGIVIVADIMQGDIDACTQLNIYTIPLEGIYVAKRDYTLRKDLPEQILAVKPGFQFTHAFEREFRWAENLQIERSINTLTAITYLDMGFVEFEFLEPISEYNYYHPQYSNNCLVSWDSREKKFAVSILSTALAKDYLVDRMLGSIGTKGVSKYATDDFIKRLSEAGLKAEMQWLLAPNEQKICRESTDGWPEGTIWQLRELLYMSNLDVDGLIVGSIKEGLLRRVALFNFQETEVGLKVSGVKVLENSIDIIMLSLPSKDIEPAFLKMMLIPAGTFMMGSEEMN